MSRIKLSLRFKLILLIVFLLTGASGSVAWITSKPLIEENESLILELNTEFSARATAQLKDFFESAAAQLTRLASEVFSRTRLAPDSLFVLAGIYEAAPGGSLRAERELRGGDTVPADGWIGSFKGHVKDAAGGALRVVSLRANTGEALVSLVLPLRNESFELNGRAVIGVLKATRISELLGENEQMTTLLVNSTGALLAASGPGRPSEGNLLATRTSVSAFLERKFSNGQSWTLEPQTGERKLTAFRSVGFGELGLVTEVREAAALGAEKKTQYRALLFAILFCSFTFAIASLYTESITSRVSILVESASRIREGNFQTHVKVYGRDEISDLSSAFNAMADGLAERDRMRDVLHKFHSREVTEELLSGEMKVGGRRRNVVVLFTDLRGFTALSENMEAEQVVEMLNEYMNRMVPVVLKHGGIVDKFVGDAILALWGVPKERADDPIRAAEACLGMREELALYNELRRSRGQPALRMGMGLNLGSVVSGNIGSAERMEYTVIGDPVNVASRIESLTKEFSTDILVSRNVADRVHSRFELQACGLAQAKGKAAGIEVYKLIQRKELLLKQAG